MENLCGLMTAFQLLQQRAAVKHASERFDKRALLRFHDDIGRALRSPAEGTFQIRSSVTDRADAHKICSIVTLVEDNNGLAGRLEIYNAAPSGADVKRLYPKGATVAVKEPYFKVAADDGLIIRVDNPANVVKVMAEKGKRTESLLHVDVEELRINVRV